MKIVGIVLIVVGVIGTLTAIGARAPERMNEAEAFGYQLGSMVPGILLGVVGVALVVASGAPATRRRSPRGRGARGPGARRRARDRDGDGG